MMTLVDSVLPERQSCPETALIAWLAAAAAEQFVSDFVPLFPPATGKPVGPQLEDTKRNPDAIHMKHLKVTAGNY